MTTFDTTPADSADDTIEQITSDRCADYEPFGWHHWPEHPWLAYQFRRGLGETQEGGGAVSEVFQAASRMIPDDLESCHAEWMHIADRDWTRDYAAEQDGHIRTAMNCFLRAANCFTATDLDLSLRSHDVDTVLIAGVNTDSCVMATSSAACRSDFAVIAVTNCVDTMDSPGPARPGASCHRHRLRRSRQRRRNHDRTKRSPTQAR